MSKCNFTISFSGSPDQAIEKARTEIARQGGNFEGDSNGGSFDVTVLGNTIKGSYTISGQEMKMVIDSKPFFVSCRQIENLIKSNMN